MWIVDSSVWIDFFNGADTAQTDILESGLGVDELGVGDVIATEVLQRFRSDADFKAAQDALLRFPVFSIGGVELCIKSAQNYRELRRRGITVRKTIDCLIATFVIERGYSLLHSDRDFSPFKEQLGLSIIH